MAGECLALQVKIKAVLLMFFLHDIIKAVTEHYAPEKSIVKRHMELRCRLNMLNCPSELNVSGSHTTSLLFIPRSLLPVFHLNVQHAVITAFTPALIVKKKMLTLISCLLTVVAGQIARVGVFAAIIPSTLYSHYPAATSTLG